MSIMNYIMLGIFCLIVIYGALYFFEIVGSIYSAFKPNSEEYKFRGIFGGEYTNSESKDDEE